MPQRTLGWRGLVCLTVLTATTVGLGLGSSTRLTYHEAFVAQGAGEILGSGQWWYPTIGGLPWLEKPPLPFWLAAICGWVAGSVSQTAARLPSALATRGLVSGGRTGGAAVRRGDRPACRRGSGDNRLDRDARAPGRGRHPASMPDRLDPPGLRPDADESPLSCSNDDPARGTRRSAGASGGGRSSDSWARLRWSRGLASARCWRCRWSRRCCSGIVIESARRLLFPAGWIVIAFLALAWPVAMVVMHGPKVGGAVDDARGPAGRRTSRARPVRR